MARVILKPRRARPFFGRHPWVLAASIDRVEGECAPGSEVQLATHEGQFIARGLYNPDSLIRVRLYRWEDAPLDEAFWRARIASAIRLREEVIALHGPQTAHRLVFSEGDGLSGLTVDRFDRRLVVQFTSRALHERRETLIGILEALTGVEAILLRSQKAFADRERFTVEEGPVRGMAPTGPVEIMEQGLRFRVDLLTGQNTGHYLDQRENRKAVASYARGRSVLDLYCYTGGFSLAALRLGGAASALGIDSSKPAIALAKENAVLNEAEGARFEAEDVFDAFARLRAAGETFGLVVLDPPKFAETARGVEDALKAYLRVNLAALDVLAPDGVLATCSCSGHVDRQLFAELLGQAAERSGRTIQILEQRGQPPDHPVSASCLETEYLKCFICRVR